MTTCPSCATEVPQQSRFCLTCGASLRGSSALATVAMGRSVRPASSTTSSSFDEGRFPPGTLLADRYRIVGMLGRGGMGEVYRANDLKLGQAVAMKFLPPGNERLLERFHGEVRIARQVSHPNVCRVYDIGDAEGSTYITMEYVDGEDLASLLRRIGRLSPDKATEMARRLCAGLSAAHDKGVLHRDLKPANVMIDGRGQVLITDFGLAGIAGRIEGGEIRNGTPAYMAPEQFAGTEVSVRSDIYSLGLILHEMFTGSLPKEGTLSQAMDPAVERVIQRCLEPDPRRRPASALAVAAALPGGDPLAAALAAGETPSPEMVAAAGENDGISVRAAVIWLALCLAGLAAVVAAGSSLSVLSATPAEFSPDVLAEKARELLVQLGYPNRPQDRASGFLYANNFVRYGQRKEKPEVFRAQIAKGQPGPLYFWYRQSPLPFAPIGGDGVVTVNDPPMTRAGMLEVHLDLTGRLIHLHAVTPQRDTTPQQSPPDWTVLLRAAGIDLARFRAVEPEWLPPDPADARAAWQGAYAQAPNVPIRVEAAAWRGRPIYFQVIGPWIEPDSAQPLGQTAGERATQWISIILAIVVVAVAAWLAWRHWTSGRGDLRGASRLAALVVAANFISWVLKAPHTLTPDESGRIMWGLAMALFLGCFYWVVYVALEPLVRRRWPQSLISWTRLLSGGLRDPLVGGHVLIGVTLGSAYTLLFYARSALTTPYHIVDVNSLLGPLHRTSLLIGMTLSAIGVAMTAFLVYFLLRAVLKNPWIAGTVFVLLFSISGFLDGNSPLFNGGIAFLQFLAVLVILMRFGLLPMMVGILVSSILPGFAMTADFSTWYSGSTMFAIGIVLALTAYAFHTARAGRALVSEGALEH